MPMHQRTDLALASQGCARALAIGLVAMATMMAALSVGQASVLPEEVATKLEIWEREAPDNVVAELVPLRSNEPEQAAAAAARLAELGPESRGAIAALLEAWHWTWPRKNDRLYIMQQRRRRDDMRQAVRGALVAIGPDAIAPIAAAAEATDAEALAVVLERMGSPESIEPLGAALRASSGSVRKSAVVALGRAGSGAIATLAPALRDPEVLVRRTAAETLAELAEPEAVAVLVVEGRRPHGGAGESLAALARIDDPRAAPVLMAAINDRNAEVAAAAVQALARIGDRSAAEALIPLLLSEHAKVYAAARDALDELNPEWPASGAAREIAPALVSALESPDSAARRRAIDVMRRTRHPAFVDPLLKALAGDDARTAAAAAGALAEMGEVRAIGPTITAIERQQETGPRDAMVGALGRLGGREALATLLALSEPGAAGEARSRRVAIEALARFDDARAVDRLLGVVAADADSGYEFMEVMTSLDALGRIKISGPSQQRSAEQLLLEVAGGNHWLDQQHTRVAGQIARKAERVLQQRVAFD